ncbi:glycosyltransferase [Rhodococcus sp. SGAir0479]|uniref:glycosyltransferase n=1 Tax=Rhodococcus sp. SGAir0479 TaxID=2567884 RepID=UPI0010CD04D3|nr:glycosyltransferase [Rhodococcus sp. SGAir0479]QCQ92556.1 glycosyltransferase [Rhodococcus sp. SGAir0479]
MRIPGKSIDVVVVCFNSDVTLLRACLDSVRKSYADSGIRGRIVLVDNGSDERVGDSEVAEGCLIRRVEQNLGFGSAANLGVEMSEADAVLILNPDAAIEPDGFSHMLRLIGGHPNAIFSGWLEKGADVQVDAFMDWRFSTSRMIRRRRVAERLRQYANEDLVPVDKVCGGALFADRSVLLGLGPFDPRFFLYGEDADLSLRAKKAGLELLAAPPVVVSHVGAASQARYGELVERARADAAIRLGAYYCGRVTSLFQRFELAMVTLLGLLVGGRSSSSATARLARLREIRRWGFAADRPRFEP